MESQPVPASPHHSSEEENEDAKKHFTNLINQFEAQHHVKVLTRGFACGRTQQFDNKRMCYLNGNELVSYVRDQLTRVVNITSYRVEINAKGNEIRTNFQTITLGTPNQIRLFKQIKIAELGKKTELFEDVLKNLNPGVEFFIEPKYGKKENFILFYHETKNCWIGKWKSPFPNKQLVLDVYGNLIRRSECTHAKEVQFMQIILKKNQRCKTCGKYLEDINNEEATEVE